MWTTPKSVSVVLLCWLIQTLNCVIVWKTIPRTREAMVILFSEIFTVTYFRSTVYCTSTIIPGSCPVYSTPKASYWLQLCNHRGAACLGNFHGTLRMRSWTGLGQFDNWLSLVPGSIISLSSNQMSSHSKKPLSAVLCCWWHELLFSYLVWACLWITCLCRLGLSIEHLPSMDQDIPLAPSLKGHEA